MTEVRRFVPRNLRDDGMIEAHEVAHYTHLNLSQYVSASDYAALAARVQAVEKERDEQKEKFLYWHEVAHDRDLHVVNLKQQLADMTRKRDEALVIKNAQLAEAQGTVDAVNRQLAKEDANRIRLEQQVARLRECVEYYAQTAIGARAVAALRETGA